MSNRTKIIAPIVLSAITLAPSAMFPVLATPSSSANYIENGTHKQHHSYGFEQSNSVLLGSGWDVRFADNRFRAFPVRYSSYKHEPRWSTIYDKWGQLYGVAVLVDVRNKTLITAWADEFKTAGLHYVHTNVRHEVERYGWNELIALTETKQLEFNHQRRLEKQDALKDQAKFYEEELALAKQAIRKENMRAERARDQVVFETVRNVEKDYELRRARLQKAYAQKQLELSELRRIHEAQYRQDTEALQEFYDNKVATQNAMVAKTLSDLQAQYQLDSRQLELERSDLVNMKSKLAAKFSEYESQRKNAEISQNKFEQLKSMLETERAYIETQEEALVQRKAELESEYKDRHAKLELEIEKRTDDLMQDIASLKQDLADDKQQFIIKTQRDYDERVALVNQREAELVKQEKLVAEVRQKYFPEFERQLLAGNGESKTRNYLKRYWRYQLDWNDEYINDSKIPSIEYTKNLNFTGNSLEADLVKMICHLGQHTPDTSISAVIEPEDNYVSIRFDTVDRVERNKFLKLCNAQG
ncbi:hypothetical protein [Vibrio parahaemolyticus]|jgi:hypothetical protein|uniref:hypothetical protein n=1 Tax=Vibrio parahaemolyticus TaxID=670 RepID=UPI0015D46A1F|nr:hypothetical protein [Vibrio parahaemolyticus]NYU23855.1 hypothetical protein [Vibrio parahaemolyticus]